MLLERNTLLFVQLHLARCLLGPGHLLGQFTPQDSSQDQQPQFKKQWLKNYRQNWQLENFNARVQLFRPGVDLDDFGTLFSNLKFLNRASSLEQVIATLLLTKKAKTCGETKYTKKCWILDLNGLLISNNQTHMGIYNILETERFQIFTVLHAN